MSDDAGRDSPAPHAGYYWSSGRRVGLGATDLVAVDLDQVEGARRTLATASPRSVSGSLVLVPEEEARLALGPQRASGPGVHPVYAAQGALLVVLPEVRVDGADEELERVRREVGDEVLVEASPGRLVLRPVSRRGEDALRLANRVTETVAPELAQARFVRVVARP